MKWNNRWNNEYLRYVKWIQSLKNVKISYTQSKGFTLIWDDLLTSGRLVSLYYTYIINNAIFMPV